MSHQIIATSIATQTHADEEGYQNTASIAPLKNGGFVVCWLHQSQNSDTAQIHGQTFDSGGNKTGKELILSKQADNFTAPKITPLSDGGFLVAWGNDIVSSEYTGAAISTQKFDANGEKQGEQHDIASAYDMDFNIEETAPGEITIYWASSIFSPDYQIETGLNITKFNTNNNLATTQEADSLPFFITDIKTIKLSNGNTLVSYIERSAKYYDNLGIHAQIIDKNNNPTNTKIDLTDILLTQDYISEYGIAPLTSGGFVVTWQTDDFEIYARIHDNEGNIITPSFLVDSSHSIRTDPCVTALEDGGFMISWEDFSENSIYSKSYSSTGEASSQETLVHTSDTWHSCERPFSDSLLNGTTVIGWTNNSDVYIKLLSTSTDNTLPGKETSEKLSGTHKKDFINAKAGNDQLFGNDNHDTLIGGTGNDTLNGGKGRDYMEGGRGNDVYIIENIGDVAMESKKGGIDLIKSAIDIDVGAYIENLTLTGTQRIDGIGNGIANTITGNLSGNRLHGKGGNDKIFGAAGNDHINGGSGNDTLTGGQGNDRFIFSSLPNDSTNTDLITDFDPKNDRIYLDKAIFGEINENGMKISENHLFFSETATKANAPDDRIIYNMTSGAVYYDPDGNGDSPATLLCTLGTDKHPALNSGSFYIY